MMPAKLLKAGVALTPTSSGSEMRRAGLENVLSGCKGELNSPTTGSCLTLSSGGSVSGALASVDGSGVEGAAIGNEVVG